MMSKREPIIYLTYFHMESDRRPSGGEIYNKKILSSFRSFPFSLRECVLESVPSFFKGRLASNIWFTGVLAFSRYERVVADAGFLGRCWISLLVARIRRKPIILILHHYNFHLKKNRIARFYDLLAVRMGLLVSDRLLLSSPFSWEETRCLFHYQKPHLVLPPSLSFNRIDSVPKVPNSFDKTVLYVGSVEPRKFIEALVFLANETDPALKFQLHVVGHEGQDPAYATAMKKKVKKSERIRFQGYLEEKELANLFMQADLFVFPSKWEGFGMAALEALAHGVPVLAFRVSALPLLIRDGINGVLVEPFDMAAWKGAFERLLNDQAELRFLSENCRLPPEYSEGWDSKSRRASLFLLR